MTRIKPEDLTTLISAAQAASVASTALEELEEMQVAHCINEAANTGETQATYSRPISDTIRTKLVNEGYTLTSPHPIAKPGDVTIISWVPEDNQE